MEQGIPLTDLQVAKSIDKLTINRFTKYMMVVAMAGFLFDSFDTSLVSYLMPSMAKEWGLAPVVLGFIASSAVWGSALGQYIWGPLSDRLGRRFAFQGTILSFGVLSGAAAFAWNSVSMMGARFLAGTGLGGFIPLDSVLIMEMAPSRFRGRMVSLLTLLFPAGQLLAVATSLLLLPKIGWRGMFLVGALPAILAWLARRAIPETPRWLVTQGRYAEARKSLKIIGVTEEMIQKAGEEAARAPQQTTRKGDFRDLFTTYLRRVILTWGLWICINFPYFGFVLWIPSILVGTFKFTLVRSLTYTVVIACCGTVGRAAGVTLIDKIGRKPLISTGLLGAGIVALIFGQQSEHTLLLLFACLLVFFMDMASAGIVTYVPEVYPTHIRGLGASWAAAMGRIAAAVAPITLGGLLAAEGYSIIWIIFAALLWLGGILLLALGIETKGKTLEEL
jgi:putative MFS transporter